MVTESIIPCLHFNSLIFNQTREQARKREKQEGQATCATTATRDVKLTLTTDNPDDLTDIVKPEPNEMSDEQTAILHGQKVIQPEVVRQMMQNIRESIDCGSQLFR